ncbi:hypothetical protein ACPCK3_15115 [Streptomyces griseoincarnatus]
MQAFHPAIPVESVLGCVFACTPDKADELLDERGDALISESAVNPGPDIRRLARSIREGTWDVFERRVTFSGKTVVEGRDVLEAISVVGVPMPVYAVVEGSDCTAAHRAEDVSGEAPMGGISPGGEVAGPAPTKNRIVLLSVTRKIIAWERGDLTFEGDKASEEECDRLLIERPEIADSVNLGVSVNRRSKRLIYSSVAGFCHYLLVQIDSGTAAWFFKGLADGASLEPGNPILTLRNRLLADMGAEEKAKDAQHVAYVFRAWNAVRAGRPLGAIVLGPEGGIPAPE